MIFRQFVLIIYSKLILEKTDWETYRNKFKRNIQNSYGSTYNNNLAHTIFYKKLHDLKYVDAYR